MEAQDLELLEKYASADPELKTLWEEHMLYEKQLEKLEAKPFKTPAEEQEVKALKKRSLTARHACMSCSTNTAICKRSMPARRIPGARAVFFATALFMAWS